MRYGKFAANTDYPRTRARLFPFGVFGMQVQNRVRLLRVWEGESPVPAFMRNVTADVIEKIGDLPDLRELRRRFCPEEAL